MFTPCLIPLADDFNVSSGAVKWVMTVFLLGASVGAFYSAFAVTRFGQRFTLIVSFFCFCAVSCACMFVDCFWKLLIGRFLQGSFAGVFPAIGYGLIQQLYEKNKASGVLSYINGSFALLPSVAPIFVGQIIENSGWQGAFMLASLISFTVGVVYILWFKEPIRSCFEVRYGDLLKNTEYILMVLVSSLIYSVEWCYLTTVQFIISLTPEKFGSVIAVLSVSFFGGSLLSARMCRNRNLIDIIYLGIRFCTISGVVLFLIAVLKIQGSIMLVVLDLMIFTFGHGLLFAPSSTIALQSLPSAIAHATGLRTAIFFALGMLGPLVATIFRDQGLKFLGFYIVFVSLTVLVILSLVSRRRLA